MPGPNPPLTAEQLAFIAWARQHLADWQQREAAQLKACVEHQQRKECRDCIEHGACVRYGCPGQPSREHSGPLPLRASQQWPSVWKRPRK